MQFRMAAISSCLVLMLLAFGPFFGKGLGGLFKFPGPCQPFEANQTEHCSELEALVQDHGAKTFCNLSLASCHPNFKRSSSHPGRHETYWGKCYCDPLCKEIGDCCVDYDKWHTPPSANQKPTEQKESCRRHQSNYDGGYIMVSGCPTSWNNDKTAHACMSTNYSADPGTVLPVLDMTTNVTYANIYCAMCHGKSRHLQHWSLRMKAGSNVSLQDIRSADTFWEAVPLAGIIPKKCLLTPSEAILGPDTAIKRLCRSYANEIETSGYRDRGGKTTKWKNPHCALLLLPDKFENQLVRCSLNSRAPSKMTTMLFAFSIHGMKSRAKLEQTVLMEVNCPINEFYDPVEDRCQPVHTVASSNSTNSSEQCRGPSFSSNEFVILNNDSVFITPHKRLYNNGSYIVLNHTLILCSANVSRNYTKTVTTTGHVKKEIPAQSVILRIITYVGFSLSIISLLFLLVTYFLFSELRIYAGKKVMHLSFAMIAMQSVYFVSDPDILSSAVCALMGAMLHFFILAVFMWMSVIAHSTQKSLSNPNVNPHNSVVIAEQRKAYIRYSLFAWGLPLLVVGICVALQFGNVGNVAYGVQDGCQLSIPARSFAVAVPVTASLLYNIIAVSICVYSIKRHAQGNMAASQSNRKLTQIVLRLTAVTGATWILGCILAFCPTPYLEYPFIIINSCQGMLICLSFVFKRNVSNLYKKRFGSATHPQPTAIEQDTRQENHSEDCVS